jgi:hypothetical protein
VSDRWIPVLAATVGIIGGLGGALIGGCVANQGQQEQFENERQAALVDMRREVYATYIQALEAFVQLASSREEEGFLKTAEQRRELIEEEGVEALTAQAAAELVAGDDVRKAVQDIDEAFRAGIEDEHEWEELRNAFIDRANNELFPDE